MAPKEDFSTEINNCIDILMQGGLTLYPTDTVWGIGCDATNEEAVAKIYELKQRSDSKALIFLGSQRCHVGKVRRKSSGSGL